MSTRGVVAGALRVSPDLLVRFPFFQHVSPDLRGPDFANRCVKGIKARFRCKTWYSCYLAVGDYLCPLEASAFCPLIWLSPLSIQEFVSDHEVVKSLENVRFNGKAFSPVGGVSSGVVWTKTQQSFSAGADLDHVFKVIRRWNTAFLPVVPDRKISGYRIHVVRPATFTSVFFKCRNRDPGGDLVKVCRLTGCKSPRVNVRGVLVFVRWSDPDIKSPGSGALRPGFP